jgi:hypothetical protein
MRDRVEWHDKQLCLEINPLVEKAESSRFYKTGKFRV